MSARLARDRQWPVAVDGAVHVHDATTGELLAIHEAPAPDLSAETRRLRVALIERTALVVACEAALADARDVLDADHPADRFLRLRLESVLRRIAAEVGAVKVACPSAATYVQRGQDAEPGRDCATCVHWQGTAARPWGHCPRAGAETHQWDGCARHISRDEHGGTVTP